ncbi:AI-2E family transporter [Candidatus Dojkabacteria bacterium]|uniref:AI-2E family transporter n=1 Tax=Candidatus Dojkabacteria bacterium TaxID=2099670 RepID=A0A955KZE8_9BACT|nr:AI-2E family transporter [Candidatus Dojkabacteria bacterium]
MHLEKSVDVKGLFFIAFLVLLGALILRVFSPFLDIIVVALVIVELFHPIYDGVLGLIKHTGLSSLITTLVVVVFVFIPLLFISTLATGEVAGLITQITDDPGFSSSQVLTDLENNVQPLIDQLNNFFSGIEKLGLSSEAQSTVTSDSSTLVETATPIKNQTENKSNTISLGSLVSSALTNILGVLGPLTTSVISGAISTITFIFLLIITLAYLFGDYHRLPNFINRVSPLDDKLDTLLFNKFRDTTRAVIIGNFLVAMAQATAVIIPMVMMNIGAPVLLWLLMVILSLIPVGSGLVFIPTGVVLAISGRPVEGIFLIIYGAIIINVIDALLRPRLLKGKVHLHPIIIIFSVIGGIIMYGPLGILYGPLLAVFFTSMMEVYNSHFSGKTAS